MITVKSPIEEFPGTIVLPKPMLLPDALEYEEMVRSVTTLEEVTPLKADAAVMPHLIKLVREWHIDGVPNSPTPETFPVTPRKASALFIAWVIREISNIYSGEQSDPNG